MLKGIAVQLHTAAGETVAVDDVLVGEPTTADIAQADERGKRVAYTLGIPKGDTNVWEDGVVVLPEPFAGEYYVIGLPTAGIEAMIPLRWNKKVLIERRELLSPYTVTLCNVEITTDSETFADTVVTRRTLLRGVYLSTTDASVPVKEGLSGANDIKLYIPFDVEAVDADTGTAREFADPTAYAEASDKDALWTLSDDRTSYIISGVRWYDVRSVHENVRWRDRSWRFVVGGA